MSQSENQSKSGPTGVKYRSRYVSRTTYYRTNKNFQSGQALKPKPKFDISKQEAKGAAIKTAAILVIGNEILTGRRRDINSHYFSQYTKNLGIRLDKVEIVPDKEEDIAEAVTRLSNKFDWVLTTGGIGPGPHDVTYAAVAKAFNLPLALHSESAKRRAEFDETRKRLSKLTGEKKEARNKLVTFPSGAGVDVIHVAPKVWTPVVRVHKVTILPGSPALFQDLIERLKPYLNIPKLGVKQ